MKIKYSELPEAIRDALHAKNMQQYVRAWSKEGGWQPKELSLYWDCPREFTVEDLAAALLTFVSTKRLEWELRRREERNALDALCEKYKHFATYEKGFTYLRALQRFEKLEILEPEKAWDIFAHLHDREPSTLQIWFRKGRERRAEIQQNELRDLREFKAKYESTLKQTPQDINIEVCVTIN